MILPFVRELLADLEHSPSFEQARRHLALARGRRRVSGLTSTARALYVPLFARAANVPVVIVVADNKAADALQVALRAGCDLTGAIAPNRVLKLPAHDVLPFENMSPHPEIQEARATTLWKMASGAASIVIAPVEAAAMKLFPGPFYAGLAQVLQRGEEVDVDTLLAHLASVGYSPMDIVEMPGQYTRRGGILDVYSPEADRPVRFEFFGDEIETIRKFDPETQRSSTPLDEALLLPLTEIPMSERLLAAVHARLSGARLSGAQVEGGDDTELVEQAIAAGGVSVFPGWEFFAGVAGSTGTLLDLIPRCALFVEERAMVKNQIDRWWNKLEQRHERSSIGSLIRPEDIYLRPEILEAQLASHPGLDVDQLGVVDVLEDDTTLGEIAFNSRPTMRFHGSIPAFLEQVRTLMAQETRMVLAAPNQGEVERLANLLREYELPYRLGSRAQHAGSENIYDESSYLAGSLRTPILVRSTLANGVSLPEANLVVFGANDFSDDVDVMARPAPRKSKTAAFVSDFRDLTVGDYVVHVEHGIAQYMGLKEMEQDTATIEFMVLEFAEQTRLYVPLT
ncbi:MAG: CarD family transcriptional regulator, partial [Silvibacterium sp.]